MSRNYKYYANDNAVCPHCDYEDRDSWEWARENFQQGAVDCGNCGKEFYLKVQHEITYTTAKTESEL